MCRRHGGQRLRCRRRNRRWRISGALGDEFLEQTTEPGSVVGTGRLGPERVGKRKTPVGIRMAVHLHKGPGRRAYSLIKPDGEGRDRAIRQQGAGGGEGLDERVAESVLVEDRFLHR